MTSLNAPEKILREFAYTREKEISCPRGDDGRGRGEKQISPDTLAPKKGLVFRKGGGGEKEKRKVLALS